MTGLFGLFRHFDCFAVLEKRNVHIPDDGPMVDPNLAPSIVQHDGHGKMTKINNMKNKQ